MSAEHRVTPTTFNQPVCGLALHTGPTTNLPHNAPSQPARGKRNIQLTCMYPTNRKLCCCAYAYCNVHAEFYTTSIQQGCKGCKGFFVVVVSFFFFILFLGSVLKTSIRSTWIQRSAAIPRVSFLQA